MRSLEQSFGNLPVMSHDKFEGIVQLSDSRDFGLYIIIDIVSPLYLSIACAC